MTEAERRRLEALRGKTDLTPEEKAELEALEAKATAGDDKTYSEDYVKTLRQESAKYRNRAKEVEERLAKLDGIDPEEYAALKKAKEDAEKAALEKKGDFDKLREQMVEQHKKDLAKLDQDKAALAAEKEALEAELKRTLVGHEVAVAAAAAQAINPRLVEMVAMGQLQVDVQENGKRVVSVVDADGQPRMDLKTGKPLTVAQLLEEMRLSPDYAHLFAGGKAGSGSGTTLFNGERVDNPWKKESFNLTLQGKILRENPTLANRLKQEAGVR